VEKRHAHSATFATCCAGAASPAWWVRDARVCVSTRHQSIIFPLESLCGEYVLRFCVLYRKLRKYDRCVPCGASLIRADKAVESVSGLRPHANDDVMMQMPPMGATEFAQHGASASAPQINDHTKLPFYSLACNGLQGDVLIRPQYAHHRVALKGHKTPSGRSAGVRQHQSFDLLRQSGDSGWTTGPIGTTPPVPR
jgi:hypothetical protein